MYYKNKEMIKKLEEENSKYEEMIKNYLKTDSKVETSTVIIELKTVSKVIADFSVIDKSKLPKKEISYQILYVRPKKEE
jgi:hypothetical protein